VAAKVVLLLGKIVKFQNGLLDNQNILITFVVMEISLEILNKYHEEGLLYKQVHPTLPLTIWNYAEKVQYEGLWDEVTTSCRGLITDNVGKIVVQPFKKFFNYEELVGKGVIPEKGDYVYVQEKMDGSLGILFNYDGEWIMATRGSFTSEQAVMGLEIVKEKYFLDSWMQDYAYLLEIIYPENRIVVNYGVEKVTFLSAVLNGTYKWNSTDDTELHWSTSLMIFKSNGIHESDVVKTEQHFKFSDELYKSLKEKNETNKEGFVLRFQPGNFRMKIKFEEYVRLHKIMTNLSTTAVWEVLSNGGNMDELLKDVPDEFYDKIKEYEDELKFMFNSLSNDYGIHFRDIQNMMDKVGGDRKNFANVAKQYKYPSLLFGMLDGKDVSPIIWKIVKPEFKKL
jgi:RNA ligase